MLTLDPALVDALKARGVELAVPLSRDDWAGLSSGLSSRFAQNLRKIYENFNGFVVPDYKSQIRLWSVPEVISKNNEIESTKSESTFYIGDFLIESDYIRFDSDRCLINMEGNKDQYCAGIDEFVCRMVAGEFDII